MAMALKLQAAASEVVAASSLDVVTSNTSPLDNAEWPLSGPMLLSQLRKARFPETNI